LAQRNAPFGYIGVLQDLADGLEGDDDGHVGRLVAHEEVLAECENGLVLDEIGHGRVVEAVTRGVEPQGEDPHQHAFRPPTAESSKFRRR
jgi:hypothetical protein